MPQKHKPKGLEEMALVAVGSWVKLVMRSLMKQRDRIQRQLSLGNILAEVRERLVAMVPWYLFDKMARQVLKSVNELLKETEHNFCNKHWHINPMQSALFFNKMKFIGTLTEVAMHPRLKQINISEWPTDMKNIIIKNLCELTGLEDLNLGSILFGLDYPEINISSAIESMTNLTTFCSFHTTNAKIGALGSNCPALQKLDIHFSILVTDSGLPALYNCKNLREVDLHQTSVTIAGLNDLLSTLPGIENLGNFSKFGRVLEKLHEQNSKPLSLVALKYTNLTTKQFKLLIRYCPSLKSVSLFGFKPITDLTILKELQNLNELSLLNWNFFSDHVKRLLECVGCNLELLHLEVVRELDLNALMYISQYCPNLKDIRFKDCKFVLHNHNDFDLGRLAVSPFASLQRLECISDCSQIQLEFLMSHCTNIKSIQLGSTTEGINDSMISHVLAHNPMKSLEELSILKYCRSLSMKSIRLLMTHCEQLRALPELECWGGISSKQLKDFRDYIRFNNIDLNTSHNILH